jgi:hypothetical protein
MGKEIKIISVDIFMQLIHVKGIMGEKFHRTVAAIINATVKSMRTCFFRHRPYLVAR